MLRTLKNHACKGIKDDTENTDTTGGGTDV